MARVAAENLRRQQEAETLAQAQHDAELDAVTAVAETAQDPIQKAALARQARRLSETPVASPIVAQRTAQTVSGLSYTTTHRAHVENLKALCKWVSTKQGDDRAVIGLDYETKRINGEDRRLLSSPWLNAEARQQQVMLNIPGVVYLMLRVPRGR